MSRVIQGIRAMTALRPDLPPLPSRMRHLAIDHRGYPVPWFVAWIDGRPEFRAADADKLRLAIHAGRCWVCGEVVGKYKTFLIGAMCAVNRVSAEPPCHLECATFSAIACPFLKLPAAKRRDTNLPVHSMPAGEMIARNPGVSLLWTTLSYRLMHVDNGVLFRVGDPVDTAWYAQARKATRTEILESIDSGLPLLEERARDEGVVALEALKRMHADALTLVPHE